MAILAQEAVGACLLARGSSPPTLARALHWVQVGIRDFAEVVRRAGSNFSGGGGVMHESGSRVLRHVVGPTVFGVALSLCAFLVGSFLPWRD